MAFSTVLDSDCGNYIFSGLQSVISDGDRVWYSLLLPRNGLEPGSQSSSPGLFQWLYGSCVQQQHCYGECIEGVARMLYCGLWVDIGRYYCRIIPGHHCTGIVWSRIPWSLPGPDMTGRGRCTSRLSYLGAAIQMCTSYSCLSIV